MDGSRVPSPARVGALLTLLSRPGRRAGARAVLPYTGRLSQVNANPVPAVRPGQGGHLLKGMVSSSCTHNEASGRHNSHIERLDACNSRG
jgi:hypothetical protein